MIIERGVMVVSGWGDEVVVVVVVVKVKPEDETTVSSSTDSSASAAVLLAPVLAERAAAAAAAVAAGSRGPVRAGKAEGGLRERGGADRGVGGGVVLSVGDVAGKRAIGVTGEHV